MKNFPHYPSWFREWLLALFLVAAVLLAYFPATRCGYIWDDDLYVTGNRLIATPDGVWHLLFPLESSSQFAFFSMVYATFRVEYLLWGLNPAGYHWVNILLHSASALVLWRLLGRLKIAGAWLAAAIWALHPVQVESVAWITELKNVLMGLFFLLALRAWVGFIEAEKKKRWYFYSAALAFYLLALCAKTTACTLPAALVLILWWKEKPLPIARWLQIAPFLAFGICAGLLTSWWEFDHQGTRGRIFSIGPVERVLIAARAVWFYAFKLLWPAKLTFSYPRWDISAANPFCYIWLLAFIAVCATIWRLWKNAGRGPGFALLFFVSTLLPVLGLFMLYTFRYTFVADHYQYLACIGPLALVAAGVDKFFDKPPYRHCLQLTFTATLLAALGTLTWRQCRSYLDEETLWRTTIARNPASWMAFTNLGIALDRKGGFDGGPLFSRALRLNPADIETRDDLGDVLLRQGRPDDAIAQYQEALRLEPADAQSHTDLGLALFQKGQIAKAVSEFRLSIRLNPSRAEARFDLGNALFQQGSIEEAISQYREALRLDPAFAKACVNLGLALSRLGQTAEAMTQYRQAIQMDPDLVEARNNLGNALLRQGDLDEAILQFREAIRISPRFARAHANLGDALFRQGEVREATANLRMALDLQPADADFQNSLAWLLATAPQPSLREGATALELATKANQSVGGSNPFILRTLAAAYAETGDFPRAVQIAQNALQLAQAQPNPSLAEALRREIKLYNSSRAFQQP